MSNESTNDAPPDDDPDDPEPSVDHDDTDGLQDDPADSVDDAGEVDDLENLGSDVGVEGDVSIDEDNAEDDLLGGLRIDDTSDITVPDRLVDQVIGQEAAREIVKRAAKQHRHVMMIGSPGTGKSLLAKAMSRLLPKESLQDVLVYHNPDDSNEPKVRTVRPGRVSKSLTPTRRKPASATRCGRSSCGS